MQQEEAEVPLAPALAKAFGRAPDGAQIVEEEVFNLVLCCDEAMPAALQTIKSRSSLGPQAERLMSLIDTMRPDPRPAPAYEALSAVPVSTALLLLTLLHELAERRQEDRMPSRWRREQVGALRARPRARRAAGTASQLTRQWFRLSLQLLRLLKPSTAAALLIATSVHGRDLRACAAAMQKSTATLIVDKWTKHMAALAGYGQEEVLRAQVGSQDVAS
jgi:hypothetical protein